MKEISKLLYKLIARNMPLSNAKLSFGAKKVRRFFTKKIIDKCGKNVNVEKGARFSEHIELGDNSGLGVNCMLEPYVKIGKNVLMGPECYIYTRNHRFDDIDIPIIQQGFSEYKPVEIEDDVWIGSRVTILPGVKIEKGSVIGAGAIVTKDVPKYSVACGNPARVVKNRKYLK